jgi:hypothetical protein
VERKEVDRTQSLSSFWCRLLDDFAIRGLCVSNRMCVGHSVERRECVSIPAAPASPLDILGGCGPHPATAQCIWSCVDRTTTRDRRGSTASTMGMRWKGAVVDNHGSIRGSSMEPGSVRRAVRKAGRLGIRNERMGFSRCR